MRVSADGWAALELDSIEDRPIDDDAIMTVDLLGGGGSSGAILGSAPVWLPDGTLLVTVQAKIKGVFREVARRIPLRGLGSPVDLVIDDDRASPWFPGRYVMSRDLSGLFGWKGDAGDPTPVTIRWDGSVAPRNPTEPPFFDLGSERWAGADGEKVVGCPLGECQPNWRRADGSLVPFPFRVQAGAWQRDGSVLLVLEDSALKAVNDEGGGGLVERTIGFVPAGGLMGDIFDIAGMNDWAAAIEGDDGMVTVIPFDGSAPLGPFPGTLAGVGD